MSTIVDFLNLQLTGPVWILVTVAVAALSLGVLLGLLLKPRKKADLSLTMAESIHARYTPTECGLCGTSVSPVHFHHCTRTITDPAVSNEESQEEKLAEDQGSPPTNADASSLLDVAHTNEAAIADAATDELASKPPVDVPDRPSARTNRARTKPARDAAGRFVKQ